MFSLPLRSMLLSGVDVILMPLLMLFCPVRAVEAQGIQVVTFASLPTGTLLTDAVTVNGVVGFVPAGNVAGEIVTDTEFVPQANPRIVRIFVHQVASFGHPSCAGLSCEFLHSEARGVLHRLMRTVRVVVGLRPKSNPRQATARLTAVTVNGGVISGSSVLIGVASRYATELVVQSQATDLAEFRITLDGDPVGSVLQVSKVMLDDAGVYNFPDFALDGPSGVTIYAGGPAVNLPFTIRRLGPSVGVVHIAVSGLPSGVAATTSDGPADATHGVISLTAAGDAQAATGPTTVTGTPLVGLAGPADRSWALWVDVEQPFRMQGPSDIDLASCTPTSAAKGAVTVPLLLTRAHVVNPPVTVTVDGATLPLVASVDPSVVPFAGYAAVAPVSLHLSVPGAVDVPATWLTVTAQSAGWKRNFRFLVHGMCPRQNQNFMISGAFTCHTVYGKEFPLAHAQVEVFRYRSDWFDDWVGDTITDAYGHFEKELWASSEGDYYARLRLDDKEGVHLNDSWTASFWSFDTGRQSNRQPIIDLGNWVISKDNGLGTPRCAIWQGARTAYHEFKSTVGRLPPDADYSIVMWKGFLTPISRLATTDWPDNYPTGEFGAHQNGDIYHDYRANFHEFGHTIRQSVDGDYSHFMVDASVYFYGHQHGYCGQSGYHANAGFAFNEGWAEYWSKEDTACQADLTNPNIEGTVAHDLVTLQACPQVGGRKGMFAVLEQGQNIVHSDGDFRAHYLALYPECMPLPPIAKMDNGMVGPGLGVQPLAAETPPSGLQDRSNDSSSQADRLRADITAQSRVTGQLRAELTAVISAASSPGACSGAGCDSLARQLARPSMLRGAIELSNLLQHRLESDLQALERGDRAPEKLIPHPEAVWLSSAAAFDQHRKEIFIKASKAAIAALAPYVSRDTSGVVAARSAELARRVRLLRLGTSSDDSYLSILKLPSSPREDTGIARSAPTSGSRQVALIVVILAVGFALSCLIGWQAIRRRRVES